MTFSVKLQSPNYQTGSTGDQIALPVSQGRYLGSSMAEIIELFAGKNAILDLGQLREVIQLVGFLSDVAAADAEGQVAGSTVTVANAIQWRDIIRRTRSVWPLESTALANWSTGITPVAEQDAGQSRTIGKSRLIFDKTANLTTGAFSNFFLYGTVLDFDFGPVPAATQRTRIPFTLHFAVGRVSTGKN